MIHHIVIGIFCAYAHLRSRHILHWNSQLLCAICVRFFKPLSKVGKVVNQVLDHAQILSSVMNLGVFGRVLRGIVLLVPLSFIVLLLLSSADAVFGEVVLRAFEKMLEAVSWLWVLKLVLALCLTIALLSIAVGWSEPIEYNEVADNEGIDGLVASIVLCGLLVIYVIFLSLQIENLVVEKLPENYREAEVLVKSGFWQLFLLAVLNVGLFFMVYQKTGHIAQWVLRLFIVASSFLMVSAA